MSNIFSLFGSLNNFPVGVMSYARMKATFTGEGQSGKRLTERAAKELVPASLKKINIPGPMDPSCPYSYSSGLQRLEEKTLNLSEPVKTEIERIKTVIGLHSYGRIPNPAFSLLGQHIWPTRPSCEEKKRNS